MANLSDYLEVALLDWAMGGAAPTRPTSRHLALYTSAPSDAGGGVEVSTGGYGRQAATFDAAAAGATSNSNEITFTATGANYGTVTHIGIFDAATAGNLLWHGALTESKIVNDGDSIVFAIGSIDLTLA